jgi:hypothetical protein
MRMWRRAVVGVALCGLAWLVRAQPDDAQGLSAASLYNEANAYARAGKPGLAVLNYERARLLAPADADIAANLATVRRAAHVSTVAPSGVAQLLMLASPDAFAWSGVVGVLLAGCGLVGFLGAPRWRRVFPALMVLGGCVVATTLANAALWWPTVQGGVIITPDTPVRVAPAPMGDSLFALHEAEVVRIDAEHEGFFLVRTTSGHTGWVAAANLARIVP